MDDPQTKALRTMRNGALEESATVADKFAEANARFNTNEREATISAAVASAIANQIRKLKS